MNPLSPIRSSYPKKEISSLSFFGGSPAFSIPLHVGRPNIGNRDTFIDRVNTILDNRWLTNNGPFVQQLERRIEDYLGVKHCIAMCNATIGLEIAIRATNMNKEVIIPSFTFIATAHALQWQQITPVFCDIDPKTFCIDPLMVESLITPNTSGIIGVHLWGRSCDIKALSEIAKKNNLKLVFDAAHAFGVSYGKELLGNNGDAEVFSFHATKFLNSLEGGAVTTNDTELANKIRLMKNFGFNGVDSVIYCGTNGKMNEISAAMCLTSLESIDDIIDKNFSHYKYYLENLRNIPGLKLISYENIEKSNYQYIIIDIDQKQFGLTRDQLMQILWAENVFVRRYFYPACHNMEPYRSYFPHAKLLLPNTESIINRVLCLPTGTAISRSDIQKICSLIKFCALNSKNIDNHFTLSNYKFNFKYKL